MFTRIGNEAAQRDRGDAIAMCHDIELVAAVADVPLADARGSAARREATACQRAATMRERLQAAPATSSPVLWRGLPC
jgi:hypothetical protein